MKIKGELTPRFLHITLGPYLNALANLQRTIDEMKNEPPSPVSIREISEVSTIEARAEGVENLSFPLNMNPIDAASRQLLKESLLRILDSFNNRERNVLEMRFGLIDGQAHTEEDVGIEFGVTRERIRQTHLTPKTLVLDG